MSTRPCCQVRARKIKHRWLCCQYVSVGSESPGARSLQGAPQVPGCRPSSAFMHRKEVAVQHHGITAGAEVHRCLGLVADSSVRRKFSVFDLETLYPLGTSPGSLVCAPSE